MDFYKHFLVLEGLCLTRHERASFVYRPGDFVITPHPDQSRETSIPEVSFDYSTTFDTKLHFITDTTLAYFEKGAIDELLQNKNFLEASYKNLKDFNAHVVAFFIGLNSSSAYEAVRFVLRYCAYNNIGHLTHEQIATITGLSRTTVTSLMHEVALAEPDLLQ